MDLLGLEFLTPGEGQKIVDQARTWIGVPYYEGGGAKSSREKADCSGAVWRIYQEASYDYDYLNSVLFPQSPRFKPAPNNIPQQGDVGRWNGHMLIYDANASNIPGARKNANALSARNPHSPYSPVSTSWWNSLGPVTWYRYDKPTDCGCSANKTNSTPNFMHWVARWAVSSN